MRIQNLTPSERILLAEQLWDSLEHDRESIDLTKDQIEELERRLQAFDLDEDIGSSWQAVKERVTGSQ